jgi:hypothetical protein
MRDKTFIEKLSGGLLLVSLGVMVSGTKACQEDYDFASQVATTPIPSATITPTTTPTDTPTPRASATSRAEPTEATTPVATSGAGDDTGLFDELSALGNKSTTSAKAAAVSGAASVGGGAGDATSGNWLGGAFSDDGIQNWEDSDGDGFSDDLEEQVGSDAYDSGAEPRGVVKTRLADRIGAKDVDMDGLSSEEEAQRGTNPALADSDQDGKPDGAEVLSGGDPLAAGDSYADTDGDGLSDEYERSKGLAIAAKDSDRDGVSDDREMVLSTHPLNPDSDGDGISDGRENTLGSDPLTPDARS